MIYLNDGFEGGETTFFEEPSRDYWEDKEEHKPAIKYAAKPVAGMCVVFDHYLFHEGSEVLKGKLTVVHACRVGGVCVCCAFSFLFFSFLFFSFLFVCLLLSLS